MSTQRPEEHGLLAWLRGLITEKAHHDTGWQCSSEQAERKEQHTDGIAAIQYPLHQPQAALDPEIAARHPAWEQWYKDHPVLHPRYADEKTGPKQRELLPGLIQEIVPQTAPYQPPSRSQWKQEPDGWGGYRMVPARQNTEGIEKVEPRAKPFRPDPMQRLYPADLPDFIREPVPGMPSGALPVRKDATVPSQSQFNDVQMTLRPSRFGISAEWQPSGPMNALPPSISDPTQDIEKWPTIHDAPVERAQKLTPVPMDPESNASTDQFSFGAPIVIGSEPISAIDELTTLAQQKPSEDTLHVPAVMKKQHTKESE